MRNRDRIPLFNRGIILKFIEDIQNHQDFVNLPKEKIEFSEEDYELLISYWKSFPDYRLTNVLIDMGIFNNVPGLWYYIEEVDWLENNKYITRKTADCYRYNGKNVWEYLDYRFRGRYV